LAEIAVPSCVHKAAGTMASSELKGLRTAEELFNDDAEDFDALCQQCPPDEYQQTSAAPVPSDSCELAVWSLSGAQVAVLENLALDLSIHQIIVLLGERVGAAPFTLRLVINGCIVDASAGQTLASVGAAWPKASVTLVRCPGEKTEWVHLFQQLVAAITSRRDSEAKRLVDMGAGFDSQGAILRQATMMRRPGDMTADADEAGSNMLHLAIRENLPDLAVYLVSRGIDIDAVNDNGRTPFCQAIVRKHYAVAKVLLEAGAHVGTVDSLGNSALTYALRQGNDELSARILKLSSFNDQSFAFEGLCPDFYGQPPCNVDVLQVPVLVCCSLAMPQTVEVLLEDLNASIGGCDPHGRTALHYAYGRHLPETVVRGLLARGASKSIPDAFGWLPENGLSDPPEPTQRHGRCTAWPGTRF